jgi:hypothetical protein
MTHAADPFGKLVAATLQIGHILVRSRRGSVVHAIPTLLELRLLLVDQLIDRCLDAVPAVLGKVKLSTPLS